MEVYPSWVPKQNIGCEHRREISWISRTKCGSIERSKSVAAMSRAASSWSHSFQPTSYQLPNEPLLTAH